MIGDRDSGGIHEVSMMIGSLTATVNALSSDMNEIKTDVKKLAASENVRKGVRLTFSAISGAGGGALLIAALKFLHIPI